MPNVTATPRTMSDGQRITRFIDSVGPSYVTWTYPKEQESFKITNQGLQPIVYTVGSYTDITVQPGQSSEQTVNFTSIQIKSTSGVQAFEVRTDEVGNTFDQPGIKGLSEQVGSLSGSFDATQVDFVKLLQEHNEVASQLYTKKLADREFEVYIPLRGALAACYKFKRNSVDQFVRFKEGSIQTLPFEQMVSQKNYDSKTGTWEVASAPNHYATAVGATFTVAFYGTGFEFTHYADNRGGIWEFVIDGDTANKITYSVYNSSITNKTTKLKSGLTRGNHTVVATFQGDDPSNPPSSGAGTARGWCYFDATGTANLKTINVLDKNPTPVKKFTVIEDDSVKEFAISVRPSGTAYGMEWVPQHGSIDTVDLQEQKTYFDDREITSWGADTELQPVKNIKIIQKGYGYHPTEPTNYLMDFVIIHTINARGLSVKAKFKFLRDTYVENGYGMMFMAINSFARKLLTGYGNNYQANTTSGQQNLEPIPASSFAFLNTDGTNGEKDIIAAMTISDRNKTYRVGKQGTVKGMTLAWLMNRPDVQKVYPHVFEKHEVKAGETYEMGGTYFIGEFPRANEILI